MCGKYIHTFFPYLQVKMWPCVNPAIISYQSFYEESLKIIKIRFKDFIKIVLELKYVCIFEITFAVTIEGTSSRNYSFITQNLEFYKIYCYTVSYGNYVQNYN